MHRRLPTALTLLAVSIAVAACGGASDIPVTDESRRASSGPTTSTVALVAYSTPQIVYDEVIPAFGATPAGRGVKVTSSFGASGEQSRAVEAGLDADVVSFSIEPDMTRLVKTGLVGADWAEGPAQGLVNTSVVSFVVRKGNPEGIRTWRDLLRPGIEVVTPSPLTSGAAKWNLLAAYGAEGEGYVAELLRDHVEVQPKSGREALQAFTRGQGDVLLSYEYEAITAQKKGEDVEYVIPDETIKIDIVLAATKTAGPAARAFIAYLRSAPAQKIFATYGYRPVEAFILAENAERFPEPSGLFDVASLGGWEQADKLFDEDNGVIGKLLAAG